MPKGSIFIFLLAASMAMTQPAAQPPRSPFAAIAGVVLNDATGAVIRHVAVTLVTAGENPLEALTFTENNGAFGFTNIPPGKYQLRADLEGFERAWFGAANSHRAPATLNLAAGDVRYGITFRLRPYGSISGTLYDPDGDPLPNAPLKLLQAGWDRMKPTYFNHGWAGTDSRGHYRFSDVTPGQYVVMSDPRGPALLSQPEAAVGQAAPQKIYAPGFYPDSTRFSEAEPLRLIGGQDLEGIDLHLTTRPQSVLHGKIVIPVEMPEGVQLPVMVFAQDVPNNAEQAASAGAFPPNYEFQINDIAAGSYLIAANASVGGRDYHAVEHLELPPGGQEITVHLLPAISLSGRVDFEGGPPPASLRVQLLPGGLPPGRNSQEAAVQPDGTFLFPNVGPGIWDITVDPYPKGGFIKSMQLGKQDVLTEDMLIEPSTHDPLHIVVSTRGAVVSGAVTVPAGVNRSARSVVLLAPSGKFKHVWSFYNTADADDSGHFEMKGVTPGHYKLFAFEELDRQWIQDPDFLKPYESSSEAFDVAEGAHVERQTQLIPVSSMVPRN